MVILRPVGTTGSRLKYLRKIRGLTRKEAAVKLDMKERADARGSNQICRYI